MRAAWKAVTTEDGDIEAGKLGLCITRFVGEGVHEGSSAHRRHDSFLGARASPGARVVANLMSPDLPQKYAVKRPIIVKGHPGTKWISSAGARSPAIRDSVANWTSRHSVLKRFCTSTAN